jgi:hypothetical protein
MAPDFSQYQPPGVYVEEEVTPLVSVVGVSPTVIAIVGPSVGYRVATQAVTLSGTTPATLSKLGINPSAGFSVAAADGTVYPSTKYATVPGAGADGDIGTTTDNTLTLARVVTGTADIPDGATVYVTYRYTDATFYAPLRATDFDDVKDAYGEPLNLATGEITSPLSLAAKVAFENGAGQLVLVATDDAAATLTTRANLAEGLVKLEAIFDVNVVVPLPVGITGTVSTVGDSENVINDLKTHCESQSALNSFRIGVMGYERIVTRAPEVLAAAARSPRIMLAWPNRLSYYNGATNTMIEVAGYYLAAAYAGRMASLSVQTPLTKKQIRSFAGLPATMAQTMTVTTKNTWSAAGVAVTEVSRDGRLIVRHGTTTKTDTITVREVSLVRAKDALIGLIQLTTDRSDMIGSPIDDQTPIRVKSVIQGCLETAKNTGIIVSYNNLKVRQTPADLSVIEVKFQYQPAYPLNYIVVSFSINTTTGETNVIEQAA